MSHIVESCSLCNQDKPPFSFVRDSLTKLNGGLSWLHSTDEDAFVADRLWLMKRIREEEDLIDHCGAINEEQMLKH